MNSLTLGWLITVVISLIAVASSVAKLSNLASMRERWNDQLRLPDGLRVWAGALELLAVALLIAPPTVLIGAFILTVYLGVAIAVHWHAGATPFIIYGSVMIALIWAATALR